MEQYEYSKSWYETFSPEAKDKKTIKECEFIASVLPKENYHTILDICCGRGRHSITLAKKGYLMTGIDINEEALAKGERMARKKGLSVNFQNLDMRELEKLTGSFHAAINLWQSFGFFDDQTNELVIQKLVQKLVPKGRLVIDLFNREFFINHLGRYHFERNGVNITETKKMVGKRLTTKLEYQELGTVDVYSFRLYTPKEIKRLLEKHGFNCLIACTHFDSQQQPNETSSRMQFVFEKKKK